MDGDGPHTRHPTESGVVGPVSRRVWQYCTRGPRSSSGLEGEERPRAVSRATPQKTHIWIELIMKMLMLSTAGVDSCRRLLTGHGSINSVVVGHPPSPFNLLAVMYEFAARGVGHTRF